MAQLMFGTYLPKYTGNVLETGNTVKPGYNDIGLYDTSPIQSDFRQS
jgi:hypothetical protein